MISYSLLPESTEGTLDPGVIYHDKGQELTGRIALIRIMKNFIMIQELKSCLRDIRRSPKFYLAGFVAL